MWSISGPLFWKSGLVRTPPVPLVHNLASHIIPMSSTHCGFDCWLHYLGHRLFAHKLGLLFIFSYYLIWCMKVSRMIYCIVSVYTNKWCIMAVHLCLSLSENPWTVSLGRTAMADNPLSTRFLKGAFSQGLQLLSPGLNFLLSKGFSLKV